MRLLSQKYLLLIAVLSFTASLNAASFDSKIFNFQQKLANAGNVDAQFKLAYLYETGRGVKKDWTLARQWYRKAGAQGFKTAGHRIKYLDLLDKGAKRANSAWLSELSADAQTEDNAMFLLANMYEKGKGVEKDITKARNYYKKATARGNADAEARLFVIEQELRRQRAEIAEKKAAEEARKKAKILAEKKAAKEKAARQQAYREKLKRQKQLKAEKERKLQIQKQQATKLAEKKRLQKLKESKTQEKLVAKASLDKEAEENGVFETDLCQGKAAKFRTQCQ